MNLQNYVLSQDTVKMTFDEVISIAREESLIAKSAEVSKKTAYWQWKSFRSVIKPSLSLNTSVPQIQKGVQTVTQNDGSLKLLKINRLTNEVDLTLNQLIPFLGGQFYVRSGIQRFDDFMTKATLYGGSLLELGIYQPVFGFNSYKWDKKIEPLKFEESKRKYSEEIEIATWYAVNNFYNLAISQINFDLASVNKNNSQNIVNIATEKLKMGEISKDEVLQAQVMLKNNEINELEAKMQMENSELALKTHLSIKSKDNIKLIISDSINSVEIEAYEALKHAKQNSTKSLELKRKILEINKKEHEVKGSTGITGVLSASMGYSGEANKYYNLPENSVGMQYVMLQLNIPILDWGKTRSKRKTIKAEKELVIANIEQDNADFEMQVISLVNKINILSKQVVKALEADKYASERYQIANKRYIAGDISLTDLNLAMNSKDNLKRNYLNTLKNYWVTYFKIRAICLYDFINKESLIEL